MREQEMSEKYIIMHLAHDTPRLDWIYVILDESYSCVKEIIVNVILMSYT